MVDRRVRIPVVIVAGLCVFAAVAGLVTLAVPVEIEYCGQYEGKQRILCCQDILDSCLRQCGPDQSCPGLCFDSYGECLEYEPPP